MCVSAIGGAGVPCDDFGLSDGSTEHNVCHCATRETRAELLNVCEKSAKSFFFNFKKFNFKKQLELANSQCHSECCGK